MSGKSILITGCSSGIGECCARGLHERGWRVTAACRQDKDVARLAAEGLHAVRLDYTDEASIHAAFEAALAHGDGRLEALFNNGAFALPGAVEDLPTDGLREIFEANFFGWHTLTRRAIPVMRAQGSGRIVQCSSVLGFVALKMRGAYNATKFALEGFNDTLRLELKGTGVHVALIEPGPIETKFRENSKPYFEKWIDAENSVWADFYRDKLVPRLNKTGRLSKAELGPEAVLGKLLHALESDRPKPRYYVTTPTYVMGAARRLLPTRLLDKVCEAGSG